MSSVMLGRQIVVGMRGDGYSNMQCLQALLAQGFTAVLAGGEGEPVRVTLMKGGEAKKFAEGQSFPVALRRLFAGETNKALSGDARFTENRDG